MLGLGDFYYELSIQIIDACIHLRQLSGGLVDSESVKAHITKARGSNAVQILEYSLPLSIVVSDDISRALATLKPLGSGFSVVSVNGRSYIQAVPRELSTDDVALLQLGQVLSSVRLAQVETQSHHS